MKFEFRHEFDATLDALERAVTSADLGPLLGRQLDAIESVEPVEHHLDGAELRRVWRFQARAPLKILQGLAISREMMTWDEHATYSLAEHAGSWHVVWRGEQAPDAPWRRHFRAEGSFRLDALPHGRARRSVRGDLEVHLKIIGPVVERVALGELRKAYAAEARALGVLCRTA